MGVSTVTTEPETSLPESHFSDAQLTCYELPHDLGVVGAIFKDDSPEAVTIGVTIDLNCGDGVRNKLMIRIGGHPDHAVACLHEIGELSHKPDLEGDTFIEEILEVARVYNGDVSSTIPGTLPHRLAFKYDIEQEPVEPLLSNRCIVLSLSAGENKDGFRFTELPPHEIKNGKIADGILWVTTHQEHLLNEEVSGVLKAVFDQPHSEIFGDYIGDECPPRYPAGGMVFSLNDVTFDREGIHIVPIEIGFKGEALAMIGKEHSSFFHEVSSKLSDHRVHEINFSGSGSLATFIVQQFMGRLNQTLENCNRDIQQMEHQIDKKSPIIASRFEERYEKLREVISEIEIQIPQFEDVRRGLFQISEKNAGVFKGRDPNIALDPLAETITSLQESIRTCADNLSAVKEHHEHSIETSKESKLLIWSLVGVVTTGLLAAPPAAETFPHLPFPLQVTILATGALSVASAVVGMIKGHLFPKKEGR